MNSLQKNTSSFEEKLAEIKLIISHPQNKNKVFVLLEGGGDIKLFRSILPNEYTDTTGCSGKDQVIKILTILNEEGLCNVIGICDADFDHLNATNNYPDNLFITDYHDMEVQMIESDALMAVIDEYSPTNHYQQLKTNIKIDIYKIATEIGYARWFNNNKKYNLRFNGLHFEKFANAKNYKITFNVDYFLTTLFTHSRNKNISIQSLKIELKKLKNRSKDSLQICNGHDLTKLIAIIFSKNNINQDKIESALRLAYRSDYFYETQLFKNLDKWFNDNNYKCFNSI